MNIISSSNRVSLWLGPSTNLEIEKHAAFTFAAMWNDLDPSVLGPVLGEDICYESQNALNPIIGKSEVLDYLSGKTENIRNALPESKVFAELGNCQRRPCVVIAQGDKGNTLMVVLFTIEKNSLSRINLCTVVPRVEEVMRSGEYPTQRF